MSVVSSVVVMSGWDSDRQAMEPLTKREETRDWSGAFTNITEGEAQDLWVNDGKVPHGQVWVGAFNHLNRPALLRDLEALPWEQPDAVKVLIRWNDEETFGLWMFRDGRLEEIELPGWHRRRGLLASARTAHGFTNVFQGYLERDSSE